MCTAGYVDTRQNAQKYPIHNLPRPGFETVVRDFQAGALFTGPLWPKQKENLAYFGVRNDDLQLEARANEQRRYPLSHRGLNGPV